MPNPAAAFSQLAMTRSTGVLLARVRQTIFDDRPPGTAKNVADKKNFQKSGLSCRVSRSQVFRIARRRVYSSLKFDGITLKNRRLGRYWLTISAVFRKS